MKLGIIGEPTEEIIRSASEKGLDFVEYCINPENDAEGFLTLLPEIKAWTSRYHIDIGSIGRWKAYILDEKGNINNNELVLAFSLIDAAGYLNCPNYVCGCNYIDSLSYYENCTRAIELFSKLMEYAKSRNVDISTYNCRRTNFVHNPVAWTIIHGHLKNLGIKYDPSHAICNTEEYLNNKGIRYGIPHAIYKGRDYLKETADWGGRFRHVHLKGSLLVDGKWVDNPPAGIDGTDWRSFIAILYAKGYDRGLSIEPYSSVWKDERGQKGLDYTIEYMKSLLKM